ncbi:MAG TPA: DUF2207 domain-containing protein [Cyclobacteriaceae bacterium]|nr:DUF2207 domain-containing protein [Cyclobacteriaceae bacterium]
MNKFILLFFLLVATAVTAQERILDFQTTLTVNKDRSVDVVEVIKVNVEGYNIQRGIYRDIITTMRDERDKKQRLSLTVIQVLKDGNSENFVTEASGINTRIKIGNADILLDKGEYTYTITYNLSKQVRFFDSYDEVYWNATGNEWMFSIDHASVTVILPEDAIISQHAGYSGPTGATGCSCTSEAKGNNSIQYHLTTGLNPYEGLTIAVGWQKGVIMPPSEEEIENERAFEKRPLYYGAIGLLVVFVYLMIAWFRVGRDPEKGATIPRFAPPDGFSPAACRYVMQMSFDKKAFTACLINMAVKGYLVIDKSEKYFKIIKVTDDTFMLSPAEIKVAEALFSRSLTILLDKSYNSELASAVTKLEEQLKAEFWKINFKKNSGWMVPAVLLTIGTIFMMLRELFFIDFSLFGFVAGSGFMMLFVIPIYGAAISKWITPSTIGEKISSFVPVIFISAFFGVPLYVLREDVLEPGLIMQILPYVAIIIALIVLCAYFFYLMKAPTVLGRKRMDEIEGLKMFMEVAEKNRLNMLNPPEKTPQLFEQLLPFAIALDVENAWSKQFDEIISKAIQNNEYSPRWYTGTTFHTSDISTSLASSFSSSIDSTSTPPSSSDSGSGGGGSSGGGGGGGGGGGW